MILFCGKACVTSVARAHIVLYYFEHKLRPVVPETLVESHDEFDGKRMPVGQHRGVFVVVRQVRATYAISESEHSFAVDDGSEAYYRRRQWQGTSFSQRIHFVDVTLGLSLFEPI